MEEPDYDDLIADAMEDAFEEPPPEDEAAMWEQEMEAMEDNTGTAANSNSAAVGDSALKAHGTPASPIATNFQSRLVGASAATASPPPAATTTTTTTTSGEQQSPAAQIRHDFAQSRSGTGDTTTDLFSFERYKPNNAWRGDGKGSPTTMRAKEWKSTQQRNLGLLSSSGHPAKRLATTPEAQLLQFQTHRKSSLCSRPHKIRIRRNDPNMSMRPREGQTQFPVTLGDGSRVYVKMVEEQQPVVRAANHKNNSSSDAAAYSLGISMTDLIRRVQAVQRKKEHDKRSNALSLQTRQTIETDPEDVHDEMEQEEEVETKEEKQELESTPSSKQPDDQLWVDKHAPSSFANLLSDERTNREVLRALREWDPYVFHREPPPRPTFLARQNNQEEQDGENNAFSKKNPNDKRPEEKRRVILLSGPPGVGKTTLAHIVAKHCGYRPLEINGSDERSAAVLTERVVNAMESTTLDMHASNQKDWRGRPNCLILDEIDGADASKALQALVELIRQETNTGKEGKRTKPYLKRPIVFICNNLYAPALRPLLPYARKFQVGAPPPARLVARLRAVLSAEGLSLWGGATLLNELVTATGGDIRSCLYTLQFAAAEVHQNQDADVSHALMSALNGIGMKDERSDVAGTTMTVFRKSKKKGRNDKLWGTKQLQDPRTSVELVLDAVESFGDNGKILDCLYLNLMNVSYIDPTFDRCSAALEWLSGADRRSIQQFYVPCASAAVHLLCRVDQRPNLTYTTRALTDAHYQTEANRGLANKFVEGLSTQVRNTRSVDVIVQETIPYALWMLSAGEGSSALCRPASSLEILNVNEKQAFVNHTKTLSTLGLTYTAAPEEEQGGGVFSPKGRAIQTIHMVLEPPIDRLVQFQQLSVRPWDRRKEIPSQMKELLARGTVLEGIRASSGMSKKLENPQAKKISPLSMQSPRVPGPSSAEAKENATTKKPLVTPLPLQDESKKRVVTEKAAPGDEDPRDHPAKKAKNMPAGQNFLGLGAKRAKAARSKKRARNVGFVASKGTKKSNTGSGVPFPQVLRLKYVKGFTQAVRNPCRLEDLA